MNEETPPAVEKANKFIMSDKGDGRFRLRHSLKYAGSCSDDSMDESDRGNGILVGKEYQAKIPEFNPEVKYDEKQVELLVWAPSPDLPDSNVDEYIRLAKDLHGYNMEQALGMLFWHNYDIELALSDLPNFIPVPDDWSTEDKVLFEQAFGFLGKRFHLIKQMLPDKSIPALVKYFYSWKGTCSKSSVMDEKAKRLSNGGECDDGSAKSSSSDELKHQNSKEQICCGNCGVTSQLHVTPKGSLCHSCYLHWRKTGLMRSAEPKTGVMRSARPKQHNSQRTGIHSLISHKQKLPKGIYLDLNDLLAMFSGPPNQPEVIIKSLNSELVSLKRMVQNNKQILSQQKDRISSGVDDFRPPESSFKVSTRWTNEELLLAVQGVRMYGKNFKAIADVIANKTEDHIHSFFRNFRHRFNLDEVLREYEAKNRKSLCSNSETSNEENQAKEAEIQMDTDVPETMLNGAAKIPLDSTTTMVNTKYLKPLNTTVLNKSSPTTVADSDSVATHQTASVLSSLVKIT